MNLNITQEDIDKAIDYYKTGLTNRVCNCPVALALAEQGMFVKVGGDGRIEQGDVQIFEESEELLDFIEKFDAAWDKPMLRVEPITLTLKAK